MESKGLTYQDKLKKLRDKGEFIVSIRYYRYKIDLYLYRDQLFEVFINHKLDRIDKIALFDYASSRIKFYTDQIKIPNL